MRLGARVKTVHGFDRQEHAQGRAGERVTASDAKRSSLKPEDDA